MAQVVYITGEVHYYDPDRAPQRFLAGGAERIMAGDRFDVDAADLEAGRVDEKWLYFLAFAALQRTKEIGAGVDFDAWWPEVAGVIPDEEPGESPTPQD